MTWSTTCMGLNCPCFRISTMRGRGRAGPAWPCRGRCRAARRPRARGRRPGSRRRPPATFLCFMALTWAAPPTRLTEMPTSTAGRTPARNRSGMQVDLAVRDRDHVRRDVRRDLALLRLDDRQGRQRAAAEVVGELHRALEQAAVQVEHVAGVGLAARGTAQQQRQLAVRGGLLASGRRRCTACAACGCT